MTQLKADEARYGELLAQLQKDPEARKAAITMLARDYAKEFLAPVRVDPDALKNVSARFIISDKEWQE